MDSITRRVGDFVNIFIKDGIQYTIYLPKAVIGIEEAKMMVSEKASICKGVSYPLLVDARYIKSISAEARTYFTNSDEGNAYISAVAILVESNISKLFGNLYLTLNTPKMPSKLFTDKSMALEWLSNHKT